MSSKLRQGGERGAKFCFISYLIFPRSLRVTFHLIFLLVKPCCNFIADRNSIFVSILPVMPMIKCNRKRGMTLVLSGGKLAGKRYRGRFRLEVGARGVDSWIYE